MVKTRTSKTLGLLIATVACSVALADTKQEHVHEMSHNVMPFDMSRTLHVFTMTESGGVQKVIVKDEADKDQIALIQSHLEHEYGDFSKGKYADPATLHGATMPGLADMERNAAKIRVSYASLPNGAALTFETTDLHALTAIHRWFGAQLSEHGSDAKAE
jgi:hypothetical protein